MGLPAELLELVRAMDRSTRKELASHLLLSLDEDDERDPDYDAAWRVELEARVRRFEAGKTQAVPVDEAFERLRARLAPSRNL